MDRSCRKQGKAARCCPTKFPVVESLGTEPRHPTDAFDTQQFPKTGNLTPNRSVLRELDSARGASDPDPVLRQGRQPVHRLGVHAKPFEKGRRYVAAAGPPVTHGPRSDGQAARRDSSASDQPMRAIRSWKLAIRQRRAGELLPSKAGGLPKLDWPPGMVLDPQDPFGGEAKLILSRLLLELFRSLRAAAKFGSGAAA